VERYSRYRQFLLLSGSRLLVSVAPLLGISHLIKGAGSVAWVSIAVGQAVGSALVVLVELNWSIMGAGIVGSLDSVEPQVEMFRLAFQERLVALFLTLPIATIVTLAVTHTDQMLAVVSSISVITLGLSPFWYWVGVGDYRSMFMVEGITKIAFGVVTIAILTSTKCAFAYPLGIMLANLCVSFWPLIKHQPFQGFTIERHWRSLKAKLTFSLSRLTQSLYVVLPIPILSLLSVADLGVYTAVDRVFRFFLTMSLPIAQFAQSNVANAPVNEKLIRAKKWRKFSVVIGILALVGMYIVVISPFPRLLFGTNLLPPTRMLAPFVFLSGVISINRIISQSNMSILASEKVIAKNIRLASITFMISFFLLVPLLRSAGAAWAMFAAETVALAACLRWLKHSEFNSAQDVQEYV
jgi:hypothetical protein